MAMIKFSAKAIRANFLVEHPDWYKYQITKILEKPSDDGQSTNFILIFTGQNGEMAGVDVSKLINEKADWIFYPVFKAANGGKDLAPDTEVNPNDLLNIQLEAYTKRGARRDGTPMNDLVDFRPLTQLKENIMEIRKLAEVDPDEDDEDDPFEEPLKDEDEDEDPFEEPIVDDDDEEDPFDEEDEDEDQLIVS